MLELVSLDGVSTGALWSLYTSHDGDPAKTGHLYVAYADKGDNSGDKADIFLVASTNNGANWTSPLRVNTIWTNDQWMPMLAVKPAGRKLFIAWYDRRSDTNNELRRLMAGGDQLAQMEL